MASNEKNILPQKRIVQQVPHILVPQAQPSASGSTMPQNYRVFVVPPTQLSSMGLIAKNENGKIIITQKPGTESRSPNTSPMSISIIKTNNGDSTSVITVRKNAISKEVDHCRHDGDSNDSKDNMPGHSNNTPVKTQRPYFARRTASRRLLPQFTKFWKSCLLEKGYVKCPLRGCNFICLSYGEITMHYYSCKGVPFVSTYVCAPCNGRLKSEEDLKTHLLRTHTYTEKNIEVPRKELPKPPEKPTAWTRKRAYSRVHKVSWNIALNEKGYVNCLFKNCYFLALDLQQMIQHYGFCNGTTASSAVHCPYCVACAESTEKLKAHILKSHVDEDIPATIAVRPVAPGSRDSRTETAATTSLSTTTTPTLAAAATKTTSKIADGITKNVPKVRIAKSAKRDVATPTSASKAVQTSFTVLDIPSYPVDHSESGMFAESSVSVETSNWSGDATPEVHSLYSLYEDHEELPVLDAVESTSSSPSSRSCYSEGRVKRHSRVYTKDYKRSVASPASRVKQPSPVPCLYADDFSLCSDAYGLQVVQSSDSKEVKNKVLVVTENPEKSVVQKLQAYVSHCNANKSYIRATSSTHTRPDRTTQQAENNHYSTRRKYEIFSDDESIYPLDYSSDISVVGQTVDESQINLNASNISEVSAEPIVVNEGHLSETCASGSLVSYTDDLVEYIIPEVVEMPQYIVPSSVEFCQESHDFDLDCRKEANYSKAVSQVFNKEKKPEIRLSDSSVVKNESTESQEKTGEVIKSQTVRVIATKSQENDASRNRGVTESYIVPLVKSTEMSHLLFADTDETEEPRSTSEIDSGALVQCVPYGSCKEGNLQKSKEDIDVRNVNVDTVTILDPRLIREVVKDAQIPKGIESGQDAYSCKRVEERAVCVKREEEVPILPLQKRESWGEMGKEVVEKSGTESSGEGRVKDAENLISLGAHNACKVSIEWSPCPTPTEILTESKINVVVDSNVNIMSISEDCENDSSLTTECYGGTKSSPTNIMSSIEEVLCERTIRVKTEGSDETVVSVVSSTELPSSKESVIKLNLQEAVFLRENGDDEVVAIEGDANETPVSDRLEMSSCLEEAEGLSASTQENLRGIAPPASTKEPAIDTESIQLPPKPVEFDIPTASVDLATEECGHVSPLKNCEGREQESAEEKVNNEGILLGTKFPSSLETQSEMIGETFCTPDRVDSSTLTPSSPLKPLEDQTHLTAVKEEGVTAAEGQSVTAPDSVHRDIDLDELEFKNSSEKSDIPLTSVLDIQEDLTCVELSTSKPSSSCEAEPCVEGEGNKNEKVDLELEIVPDVNETAPTTSPLVPTHGGAPSLEESSNVLDVSKGIGLCPLNEVAKREETENDTEEQQGLLDTRTIEDPRHSEVSDAKSNLTYSVKPVDQNVDVDLGDDTFVKTEVSNSIVIDSSSSVANLMSSPGIVDNESLIESGTSKDISLCEIGQEVEEGTTSPLERSTDVHANNSKSYVNVSAQELSKPAEDAVLTSSSSPSQKEIELTAVPVVENELAKDVGACETLIPPDTTDTPEQEKSVVVFVSPDVQKGSTSPGMSCAETSQTSPVDIIERESNTKTESSVIQLSGMPVVSSGEEGVSTFTNLDDDISGGNFGTLEECKTEQRNETMSLIVHATSTSDRMPSDQLVNTPPQSISLESEERPIMEQELVLKLPHPELACNENDLPAEPSLTKLEISAAVSVPESESNAVRVTCSSSSVIKMGSVLQEKLADAEDPNSCSRLTQLAEIASSPSDYQNDFALLEKLDKHSIIPEASVTQIEQKYPEPHENVDEKSQIERATHVHFGVIRSGVSNKKVVDSDFELKENESIKQEVLPVHPQDDLSKVDRPCATFESKSMLEPVVHQKNECGELSSPSVIVSVQMKNVPTSEKVDDESQQNVSSNSESIAELEQQHGGVGEKEPDCVSSVEETSECAPQIGVEVTRSDEISDKSQETSQSSCFVSEERLISSEDVRDTAQEKLPNIESSEYSEKSQALEEVQHSEIKETDTCERELERRQLPMEGTMENVSTNLISDLCSSSLNREDITVSHNREEHESSEVSPHRLKEQDAETSVSKSDLASNAECNEILPEAVPEVVENGPNCSLLLETSLTVSKSSENDCKQEDVEVSIEPEEKGETASGVLKEDISPVCEIIETELEGGELIHAKKAIDLQSKEDEGKMENEMCAKHIEVPFVCKDDLTLEEESIAAQSHQKESDEDTKDKVCTEVGEEKPEKEKLQGDYEEPVQEVCEEAICMSNKQPDETTSEEGELKEDSLGVPNKVSVISTPEVLGNEKMVVSTITGHSEKEVLSKNVMCDSGSRNISLEVASSSSIEQLLNVSPESAVAQPEEPASQSFVSSESHSEVSELKFEKCETYNEERLESLESEVRRKSSSPIPLAEQDCKMMECTEVEEAIPTQLENVDDAEAEETESICGGVDELCDVKEGTGDHDIYSHENVIRSPHEDPARVLEGSNFKLLDSPKITNADKKIYSIQDLQDILEGTDDSKQKLDVDEINHEEEEPGSRKDEIDSLKSLGNDSLEKSGKICEYPVGIPSDCNQENTKSFPVVSQLVLNEVNSDSSISHLKTDLQTEIVCSPSKKRRHSTDCVSPGAKEGIILVSDGYECDGSSRKRKRRSSSSILDEARSVRRKTHPLFLPSVNEGASDATIGDSLLSSSSHLESPLMETQDLPPAIPPKPMVPMNNEAKNDENEEKPELSIPLVSEDRKNITLDPKPAVDVEVDGTPKRRESKRKRKPKSYGDCYEGEESLRPAKRTRRSVVSALLNEDCSSNSSEGSRSDPSERRRSGRRASSRKRSAALEENSTCSEMLSKTLNGESSSSAKGLADESKEDIVAFDSEASTMSEDSLWSKGDSVVESKGMDVDSISYSESSVVSEDSRDGADLQEADASEKSCRRGRGRGRGRGSGSRGRGRGRGRGGSGRGRGSRGRKRGGRGSRSSSATRQEHAAQDKEEEQEKKEEVEKKQKKEEVEKKQKKMKQKKQPVEEGPIEEGPVEEVQCGKCKAKMPKPDYESHNYQTHNGLGWLQGEPPFDISNAKRVLSVLWKTVKFHKKTLTCEECGVTKKSAVGFHSHVELCHLTVEEREAMKVKCTVCDRSMTSASLKVHMQGHRNNPVPAEELVDTTRVKRAAAAKASSLMQEVIKEEADVEEKKKVFPTDDLGSFYKRIGSTRPCNPLVYRWKCNIAADGTAKCHFPGCLFKTPDISVMTEHFGVCNNRPRKGFRCELCNFVTTREGDIKKHLAQEHLNAPDPESDVEEKEVVRRTPATRNLKICNKLTFLATEFCGTVAGDKPFIPAAKWTYKFWRENFSLEDLFPEYHTSKADWIPLSSGESEDYLPKTRESISYSSLLMRDHVVDIKNRQFIWKKLNLFQSEIVDDVPTLFAGGPVLAMAWCLIPALKTSDQYLAVSCLSGMDDTFHSKEQFVGKGLIQLWNFGPLDNLKRCSQEPKFVLGLAHDFGVISDLQWCPSGCFNETASREDCLPRLGLLAAACSDGFIHIFSVCLPSVLESKESFPIFKCKPVMTLKACENPSFILGNIPWNCLRLSWYKGKDHRIIAGGFTNGVVALWDIKTQSPFLQDKGEDHIILFPYKSFQAHYSCVTALSLAPQDEGRYLMSGSLDSAIKVWDLENFSGPIPPVLQRGMVTDGEWLTHWLASITSYDDVYNMGHCNATLNPPRGFGYKVYPLLPQNSVAWSLSSSDWANSVAQCTHAGELTTIFPHQLVINVDTEKGMKDKRIVLSYVELVDNLQKSIESNRECNNSCRSPCKKHLVSPAKRKMESLKNQEKLKKNEKIIFENEDTKELTRMGVSFILERSTRKGKSCVIRPFPETEDEEEKMVAVKTNAGGKVSDSVDLECISNLDPHEKKLILNFKKDLERLNVTSKLKVTFPYHNNARKKSNSHDNLQEFLMVVGAVQEPSDHDGGSSSSNATTATALPEKEAAEDPSNKKACDEYNDIKDRFGMVFCHFPTDDFSELPFESRKWMRRSETMRTAPVDMYPITSLNKVKWNPNFRSFLWLASGYQCGILRVPCVSGMHNQQVEHILKGAVNDKVTSYLEDDS